MSFMPPGSGSPHMRKSSASASTASQQTLLSLQPVIVSLLACSIIYWRDWQEHSGTIEATISWEHRVVFQMEVKILAVHRRYKYGASTVRGIMIVWYKGY